MPNPAYRRCNTCGVEKPLEEFHKHKKGPGGRLRLCKECRRAYERKRYAERAEEERARSRERHKEHRDRELARMSRYATSGRRVLKPSDPKKQHARQRTKYAVQTGRLVKPTACESCHKQLPSRKIHAHHVDYDKPLEVEWLCRDCHSLRHRAEPVIGPLGAPETGEEN